MRVTIIISKKDAEHLKECTTHYDACGYVESVINKVKKQLKEGDGK